MIRSLLMGPFEMIPVTYGAPSTRVVFGLVLSMQSLPKMNTRQASIPKKLNLFSDFEW